MTHRNKDNKPSRPLSTFQFFEIIQIEYICALLRSKIYVHSKDKEYWARVAEGKRAKIEQIVDRNPGLPSIFSDSDLENALSRRVYRDTTYPIFIYRDEEHRLSQEYLDLQYYYYKDTDVRYDIGLGVKVGKIKSYKPFDSFVCVLTTEKEEIRVPVDKIARIL